MEVYRAKSVCIVFLLKAANILCISAVMKGSKKREGRESGGRGRQDVVDLQGNGYFSKLLIISFLCPLNEGYKVNTLYNKAPADASFAHFQRLHCLLGIRKKTWTSSGGISGILWASSVPLSAGLHKFAGASG